MEYLRKSVDEYRQSVRRVLRAVRESPDPAMRDANPVVVLLPGVGRFAFAADKTTARLASEFYGNAINVMRGATAIGRLCRLPESRGIRDRVLGARGSQTAAHAEAQSRWREGLR